MAKAMASSSSPYLLQPRRNLRDACKQKNHACATQQSPCKACSISDICSPQTVKPRRIVASSLRPPYHRAIRRPRHGGFNPIIHKLLLASRAAASRQVYAALSRR